MKAKLFDSTEYLIDDAILPEPIIVKVAIAPGSTSRWIGTLEMEMDTGSDIVSIPLPIIKEMELAGEFIVEDNVISENADGSESTAPIIMIDLRIPTTGGQHVSFYGVKCVIPAEGSTPLLGRSILSQLSIMLKGGQITHMEYNPNKSLR